MATPTNKCKPIDDVIEALTGKSRTDTIEADVCVLCGGNAWTFKDELSKKEYSISGMCQRCQDKTFGTGDD